MFYNCIKVGSVDILINCAGMAKAELFEDNLSTYKVGGLADFMHLRIYLAQNIKQVKPNCSLFRCCIILDT